MEATSMPNTVPQVTTCISRLFSEGKTNGGEVETDFAEFSILKSINLPPPGSD